LTAFYFERVSLVGLPATLLVLPALPFVLISQAATALVGLMNTGLAQPFSWAAWVFTNYVINVVDMFSRLPGASYETRGIGQPLVWVYYGLLILALVLGLGHQINRRVPVRMPDIAHTLSVRTREGAMLLVLIAATAAAVLMWTAAFSQPDDRLHVYFIDVGQGEAIFIETPGGQQILVDGGPDPSVVLGFLGDKMPFRDRTIELVVLTHAHNDHINGLTEVLRRYNVERILERQTDSESPAYYAWRSAVLNEGASITQAQSGQIIGFDDGVYIQVLNPHERLLRGTASDVDNASVVLRLVYGEVSFLLTGDMFSEAERALVARNAPIEADVLKVGHHGSRSSSSSGFLDMVGPAIAVISAGEDNRFGHPHEEVVEALRSRIPDELIFVTGEYGTIEITTDGKQLDITTEREP
ncbi:MAG: ComEC/Rec2 family competence protein, partial [Chloroflexi bacterium]|nr:ComEC/Rec2 family competence protein [Chloroflexota bacterium]